nr:transporter substrate-binding domain-containing protein [Secundilactobacillus kimchicus]
MYFNTNEDGKGVGIVMKKGNTKLQKQVNNALAELKKDGTLKKISEKFYQADVTKKAERSYLKNF